MNKNPGFDPFCSKLDLKAGIEVSDATNQNMESKGEVEIEFFFSKIKRKRLRPNVANFWQMKKTSDVETSVAGLSSWCNSPNVKNASPTIEPYKKYLIVNFELDTNTFLSFEWT